MDASLHRQFCFRASKGDTGIRGDAQDRSGENQDCHQAATATSSTGLPACEQQTGGGPTGGADAQDEGSGSYLCTLVAFQAWKPQGPFLSLQRKDKTRRH